MLRKRAWRDSRFNVSMAEIASTSRIRRFTMSTASLSTWPGAFRSRNDSIMASSGSRRSFP